MRRNSINVLGFNSVVVTAILFVCSFLVISRIFAQPTSTREYSSIVRKRMTENRLDGIAGLTKQIANDSSNVALYKKRIEAYQYLLESVER